MKVINNKKELLEFASEDDAYDIDSNWVICEMEYDYPILIECFGYDLKGCGYKIRTKKDLDVLKQFINL